MSKVLEGLAHELWAAAQLAPGEGISDGVARLAALLAQPAEAEGVVPVVCYLRAFQDGTPHWTEDCVCEDAVYPNHDDDETYSMPMVRQSDHLAALSAVTAERDRLLQELAKSETNTMALMVKHFAGSMSSREQDRKLDECLSEGIAMLEAERDRLRKDVERYQWLKENVKHEFFGDQIVDLFTRSSQKIDRLVDAAMAAKEA